MLRLRKSRSASLPRHAENFNYPNPPAWGLSYRINGEESPVLAVTRGTTYTFKGARHSLWVHRGCPAAVPSGCRAQPPLRAC